MSLQKIYSGVFGSGLGHIARIYSIAGSLEDQCEARFFYSTFEEALDFLRRRGEVVVGCPFVEVQWNPDGGFSGWDTIMKLPYHIRAFSSQIAFESGQISRYDPKVVISDSRLSTIIAAKANRYPTVTIVNQFKILFPPKARQDLLSMFYERIGGDTLGFLWSLSDYVLFPDLPLPFTIGEANIASADLSSRVHFTGFISPRTERMEKSPESVRRILELDSRPLVFIQISGPEPTKPFFIETALKAIRPLSEEYNVVISKGIANGSSEPLKLTRGVWVFEWCPFKDELFMMSDLVVARAGHSTIGQCIENGKQAVLIPIYNHSEQISNADKFVKLGQGIEIRSENLTVQTLVSSVKTLIEDSRYRENALKLKKIYDKYDGNQATVEFVKEFF